MKNLFFNLLFSRKLMFLLTSLFVGQTFAGVTTNEFQSSIIMTEIMQSNFGGVIDYYNEFPDSWVEVYNSGETDLDLEGFSIGDVNDISQAYTIPCSYVVPAKGHFLIFCDKENMQQHTHFRLKSDEPGSLYLWDNNGVIIDSLHYPEMISPEVSWGRLPNNTDSLSHFRVATPEQPNNDTYTERVMKTVGFSEKGGIKTTPFYLKLSIDSPADAVIRYTTDGSEPTSSSSIFHDSIYISGNTVIRAKPFSDSAISRISRTQTYIFDRDGKMPIISIACDESYLTGDDLGIFSYSTSYSYSHPDNPPLRHWMGDENYLYNWRRPINIEYFSSDSTEPRLNQLAETRVSGNASREYSTKSMVVYANKRFGNKHFKGVFWRNLKPNATKQKSMTIRTSNDEGWSSVYSINDLLSQTAIGRFARYYDVDYQAHKTVLLYINGRFERIMHLQERDGDDFVWANHNKIEDIEILETFDGLTSGSVDEELYPNFAHFLKTYESENSTYQQMSELLDINAFMNFVSTQAYFANIDFPSNNAAAWYDKQGTKKWRWIMKDMDATMYESSYAYYNFLLRKEPFEYFFWANSQEACMIYQKMFSLEKFKQPYLDRTCVLAGTAFSNNTLTFLLDCIVENMSLAMTAGDLADYIDNIEKFYLWSETRPEFYYYDLSQFFELGDTTQLTIRSNQNDSLIYFNNNPLVGNKFDGYFFEGRDIYLTHNNKLDIYGLNIPNTNEISYLDLGAGIKTNDPAATSWTISYDLENQRVFEHYENKNLHYKIPVGAKNVYITDGYYGGGTTSEPTLTSRSREDLTYMVYNIGGLFVGKFTYKELCDFKQSDDVNIVVVLDSLGRKVYSFKLLKSREKN